MLVGDSRHKLGAKMERFVDSSQRMQTQSYGVDLILRCNHYPRHFDATSPEAYLQHPPSTIDHPSYIDMADNKTAALRKQLKIKAGVVKRWVSFRSDQIMHTVFLWGAGERLNPSFSIILRFSICALHTGFVFTFFPSHYTHPPLQAGRGSWTRGYPRDTLPPLFLVATVSFVPLFFARCHDIAYSQRTPAGSLRNKSCMRRKIRIRK